MATMDKAGLTEDYPPEYSSYLSIDVPYLDEVSSESSAREAHGFCREVVSTSTEDLTSRRLREKSPCVVRQISRTRSMDRYRAERRSTRSSARKPRRASTTGTHRAGSFRPSDMYLAPPEFRRPSTCPSRSSQRLNKPIVTGERARKEKRRRRIVLIVIVSFLALVLASVLVVVVTLTHSSSISVHNVTSKYYTFAVPPHHPLIRQENERMMHESLNIGLANSTQPTMELRKSFDER